MGELEADAAKVLTCRCGHDRKHFMISKDAEYSFGGWLTVLLGISTVPRRLKYRCTLCGEILETVNDPRELRSHLR